MIPCNDCLVLAVCKNKDLLICDILQSYMRENTEYSEEPPGALIKGEEVWNEVDRFFQRQDDIVRIESSRDQGTDDYVVESKGFDEMQRKEKLLGIEQM